MKKCAFVGTALALILMAGSGVSAQTMTGTPGAPSATTTIDGRQIPPPPAPFRRRDQPRCAAVQALLAAAGRAAARARRTCS